MSQKLINAKKVKIEADEIEMDGPVTQTELVVEDRLELPGSFAITSSVDDYFDGTLVDSRGVVPSGTLILGAYRINDFVMWSLQQIDGATPFTCGATNAPLWLAKWPLSMRPTQPDPMYMPITVQHNGDRETMFLIVGQNGDISINTGDSVLFTSGNLLSMGGGGVFIITSF